MLRPYFSPEKTLRNFNAFSSNSRLKWSTGYLAPNGVSTTGHPACVKNGLGASRYFIEPPVRGAIHGARPQYFEIHTVGRSQIPKARDESRLCPKKTWLQLSLMEVLSEMC
ncbi:MAG: hypothetical protein FWD73_15110 [Polyangiaceae bacterium]|nr:hypothetical protein [Polyangiaceae bacterium]